MSCAPPSSVGPVRVRQYGDSDAANWLECRLLSFFRTQYYDDVVAERPEYSGPAIQLVAVCGEQLVGLLDIEIDNVAATIEVIAVLPSYAGRGIGSALLAEALPQLRVRHVETLDAWTREDIAANRWYQARGFLERYRYLHVHKEWDDDDAGFASPPGLSAPVRAFAHAAIEREAEFRSRFRRVYVCRQYVLELAS